MSDVLLREDKKSSFDMFDIFILIAFSYESVMVYFSAVFARLPIIGEIGYQILPLVVNLFAVVCFVFGYFKRVKVFDVLFILCFIMVIVISYLFHPSTQEYYTQSNMRNIYVETIPFFLLGLCFRSEQKTIRNLTYISYVAVILNAMYMFLYVGLNSKEGEYYMGQAYMILPHVMFTINSIFDRTIIKNRVVPVVFSLMGIVFLVAMGTRGPLLIAVVYLAVRIFVSLDKKNFKSLFLFALVLIGLIWVIASGYYISILFKLANILSNYGMSTRIIDMLLGNEYLSHTSGRDRIYELLIEKIAEKPILGYGIFGEEQFNVFAHSIPLEILMYYGVPVGVTVMVSYIITSLTAYFKSKNKYAKDLILLFFVMIVAHAPFGGSHLSYYFFFLLGLSILELRNCKKRIEPMIEIEGESI